MRAANAPHERGQHGRGRRGRAGLVLTGLAATATTAAKAIPEHENTQAVNKANENSLIDISKANKEARGQTWVGRGA